MSGNRQAVESEKTAALKRILFWIMCDKEGLANEKKIKILIEDWDFKTDPSSTGCSHTSYTL